MDALHEKGLFTDPRVRHESVYLTDEGKVLATQQAAKYCDVGDSEMSR
jgi:hypothetical protein